MPAPYMDFGCAFSSTRCSIDIVPIAMPIFVRWPAFHWNRFRSQTHFVRNCLHCLSSPLAVFVSSEMLFFCSGVLVSWLRVCLSAFWESCFRESLHVRGRACACASWCHVAFELSTTCLLRCVRVHAFCEFVMFVRKAAARSEMSGFWTNKICLKNFKIIPGHFV